MLTIWGKRHTQEGSCDGISRRSFLRIGGTALGGLSLPGLLASDRPSAPSGRHKAFINIYLPGGPPHQDMWDLKTDCACGNTRRVQSDSDQCPWH